MNFLSCSFDFRRFALEAHATQEEATSNARRRRTYLYFPSRRYAWKVMMNPRVARTPSKTMKVVALVLAEARWYSPAANMRNRPSRRKNHPDRVTNTVQSGFHRLCTRTTASPPMNIKVPDRSVSYTHLRAHET